MIATDSAMMLRTILVVGVMASTCAAQPANPSSESVQTALAKVGDVVITRRDVQRQLRSVPGAHNALQGKMLQQLIRRELILALLRQRRWAASDADIDLEIERIDRTLQSQGRSMKTYLTDAGLLADELRRSIAWRLSWRKYLDRHLTDENLEKFFHRHRHDFDGTELRVAHILLTVDSEEKTAGVEDDANDIRNQIMQKQQTFEAAARKHSTAPSATTGGNIGWIRRNEPMPKAFSDAAFALAVGEVSAPVRSQSGIHLIQCLEIKPGKRSLDAVRPRVEAAATRYLFDWLADQQKGKVDVIIYHQDATQTLDKSR